MLSHFPFFCADTLRKQLIGRRNLKAILEKYTVALFLHGHTHNQTIANLYPELPIVLDSGSCSHVKRGSFHILQLSKNSVELSVYTHHQKPWQVEKKASFFFRKACLDEHMK